MIPAPLVLIVGPLVLAVIVYLVRRITLLASLLSTAAALAMAWLANNVPPTADQVILGGRVAGGQHLILGRSFFLSPSDQVVLMVLSVAAAVLFVLAICLRPDDIFFPGLLALLGLGAAVLVTETFVFTIFLVQIAAGLVTVLIQGSRYGSSHGSWRFFLFTTLATPFLLVAGWQIYTQTLNPSQMALLNPAVLLLTLGFAIYLAAVPFHLWLAPVAREAQPLVQIAVFCFFQIITFAVVTGALEQFNWLADSPIPFQWFTFVGTLAAGLGALLAFGADSFGKLAAYSLLSDMGAVLLLLGLKNPDALHAAWVVLFLRIASLTVWAAGLTLLRQHTQSDRIDDAAGLGWKNQWGTAVLVLGGLSLVGLPLTPGFAGRWMAVGLVAQDNPNTAVLLLLASLSGMIGTLRMARTLLATRSETPATPPVKGAWLTTVMLIIIAAAAITLSRYPNPILTAAGKLAETFSYLP